ncbi:MAG: GAF domain-containing protein [Lachnospiraceae bacterium]|nr:GAF domain-containing protein [Lachnospiraceae bacterium]
MKEKYKLLHEQLIALMEGEKNFITILSNAAALLNETLEHINWVGFYLYDKEKNELFLGPFQGKPACTHIPMNQGVCGTSAYQQKTLRVENVHHFKGHIACDSASNSEIVLPIIIKGTLFGVLDIDSPQLNRFDEVDQTYLEKFVHTLETILNQSDFVSFF